MNPGLSKTADKRKNGIKDIKSNQQNFLFKITTPYLLKVILCSIIFIQFLTGCKDKPTSPEEQPKPPGYQEDIPWPSLADSPWPIHHSDPQSTGRSKFNGPLQGQILWEYYPESNSNISGATVIDDLENILFLTSNAYGGLIRINNNGVLIDSVKYGNFFKSPLTPIITTENSVIFGDGGYRVFSLSKNGILNWTFEFPLSDFKSRNLNVDKEGNIYFVSSDTLYSISKQGNLNWNLSLIENNYSYSILYNSSFSPDGNTIYITGTESSIIAVDIKSISIKWRYGNTFTYGCAVDNANNIYLEIYNTGLISLDNSGNIRWQYNIPNFESGEVIPAIDKNGNTFFASDTLYSFNYKGEIRWKLPLSGLCDTPIISDLEGNLYLGTLGQGYIRVMSVTNDGTLIWSVQDDTQYFFSGSFSINANKFLFVTAYPGKLFAIY